MDLKRTRRGFSIVSLCDYYGNECSIQKSSLATEECIWLGVNDPKPKIMASKAAEHGVVTKETTGWIDYPIPEEVSLTTRMHLTRDQVAMLLPYLHAFVENGDITI